MQIFFDFWSPEMFLGNGFVWIIWIMAKKINKNSAA